MSDSSLPSVKALLVKAQARADVRGEGDIGDLLQQALSALDAFAQEVARETLEGINAKVATFRSYSAWGARNARGHTFLNNPYYDPADLCAAQERAIRQLQEYLDPKCDDYLRALVEMTAARTSAPGVQEP